MSLGIDKPAAAGSEPERPTIIGGSTRFVPGQSHDRITVVNGKVQLGQRLMDLWRNRDLLMLLVRTELKVKYKESVLGYAWSMLNPALVLAIYYVVFKIIARNHQPHFAIWLFAACWCGTSSTDSAMGSTTVVVGKAGIIKKVAFPRELLAMSVVGVSHGALRHPGGGAGRLPARLRHHPGLGLALAVLPLALVALLVFTGAVSIFLSAVNVYLRDTQHLTEVLLMAWFWGTSIVYTYGQIFLSGTRSPSALNWLQYVYLANPITPIAMTFQRAIYGADVSTSPPSSRRDRPTGTHVLPTWSGGRYAGHAAASSSSSASASSSSPSSSSAGSRATSPRSSEPWPSPSKSRTSPSSSGSTPRSTPR